MTDTAVRLKWRADQLDNAYGLKRAQRQGVILDYERRDHRWVVTIPNGNFAVLTDREVMFFLWGVGITNTWAFNRGKIGVKDMFPD